MKDLTFYLTTSRRRTPRDLGAVLKVRLIKEAKEEEQQLCVHTDYLTI